MHPLAPGFTRWPVQQLRSWREKLCNSDLASLKPPVMGQGWASPLPPGEKVFQANCGGRGWLSLIHVGSALPSGGFAGGLPSRRLAALRVGAPRGAEGSARQVGEEALGSLESNLDESVGSGPSLGVLPLRGPRPCRRLARTSGQGQGLLHTWRRASWAGTVPPGPRGAGLNPVQPAGPKPGTGLGLLSEARAPRVGQEGRSFGDQAAIEGRVSEPPGMLTQASGELSALLPEAGRRQPTPGLGGGGGWVSTSPIWGRGAPQGPDEKC